METISGKNVIHTPKHYVMSSWWCECVNVWELWATNVIITLGDTEICANSQKVVKTGQTENPVTGNLGNPGNLGNLGNLDQSRKSRKSRKTRKRKSIDWWERSVAWEIPSFVEIGETDQKRKPEHRFQQVRSQKLKLRKGIKDIIALCLESRVINNKRQKPPDIYILRCNVRYQSTNLRTWLFWSFNLVDILLCYIKL